MSASLEDQLLEAVGIHDHVLVKRLLDQGARVNEARDAIGVTCLLLAIHKCRIGCKRTHSQASNVERTVDIEMVKLLLKAGADVKAKDSFNNSCLHYAVKVDQTGELTKILLEAGAKSFINEQDIYGYTPLRMCVEQENWLFNRKLAVQTLIEAGAEFSRHCLSRLRLGQKNDDDMLRILLKAPKADEFVKSSGYSSIIMFHVAVKYSRIDIVEQMVDLGVDVNCRMPKFVWSENTTGDSPLHIAVNLACRDKIMLLLKHGADCDAVNSDGESAFSAAVKNFKPKRVHKDILRALLKHRKRDNASDGSASLREILQCGSIDCFEFYRLLVKDASIQPMILEEPLLIAASMNRRHPMVSFLLDRGICNVNEKFDNGLTALHKLVEVYSALLADHRVDNLQSDKYLAAIKILILNIALLKSKKRYIDPSIHIVIKQNAEFNRFYESCKIELDSLRSNTIVGPVTYYSIVAKDRTVMCIRNDFFIRKLDLLSELLKRFRKNFPIYNDLLRSNVLEMTERQCLMEGALLALQSIIKIDLDTFSLLYDEILCNLNNEDLDNLGRILDIE